MGVVPQDIALYEDLSGRENLEFWGRMAGLTARAATARTGELLEALALTDRARDALKTYSGGMKRRVNLVRVLIVMNSLLVEHAIATDGAPPTESALRELLRRENPVSLRSSFAVRKPMPVGFSLSLPGNLVMYLLLNLMVFGGASVAAERRNGVMRRRWAVVGGRSRLLRRRCRQWRSRSPPDGPWPRFIN